jgi:hypothetical protein
MLTAHEARAGAGRSRSRRPPDEYASVADASAGDANIGSPIEFLFAIREDR